MKSDDAIFCTQRLDHREARGRSMKGRELLSPRQLVRRFSPVLAGRADAGFPSFNRFGRAPWRSAAAASLGRLGELEVRLATSAAEVRRAQALRYHVFYEEMSAVADARTQMLGRDADPFDLICDHLLVLDHANLTRPLLRMRPEIVGTYRLLRQEVAERNGGFYTAGEYELGPLLERKRQLRFMELGRSCVLAPYRNKRTVELLWHGIWAYVLMHGVDVMIGCASLEGTDPDRLAMPLSFLHHTARAPEEWRVRAQEHLRVDMDRMPLSAIDTRAALRSLPPLVKGYLRLGAYIGDGAVVDHQFGTTDVCIILPVSAINPRYVDYYGPNASRYAS
jgi:putative hemolysin